MIYTCYDMVRDCREGRASGWSYFVANYIPVIRRIVGHYSPENSGQDWIERLLRSIHQQDSPLFQSHDPSPERWFVAALRQHVLAVIDEVMEAEPATGLALDLPLLSTALESLTVIEKQAVWFETMHYAAKDAATLLRMEPRTVEKIRDRAAELLRGALDTWRRTLLADHGRKLGRLAAGAKTTDCPAAKVFLDTLDGRSTWQRREELERHVTGCWHCIDHFCRMAEVLELVRGIEPLAEDEAARFCSLLGIEAPRKAPWKRWLASR